MTRNEQGPPFTNKIKVFRAIHDLTQEELAVRLDVSRQTIVAIESNKYLPSLGLAFKIAGLFKVRIEDVFIPDSTTERGELK